MGKDSPTPPDYAAAAKAQAAGSKENTIYQTWSNRPNIKTPWGSQTWSQGPGSAGTPASFDQAGYDAAVAAHASSQGGGTGGLSPAEQLNRGGSFGGGGGGGGGGVAPTREQFTTAGTDAVPGPGSWETQINLSPDQQAALDAQQRITMGRSNAAETLLGQANSAFQQPMDYGALPKLSSDSSGSPIQRTLTNTAGGWREKGQSAIEQLMAPQLAQRRGAMESRLANQGITMGSPAWEAAMRSQGDTETRAGLSAIDSGRLESDSLFSKDLQSGQFANSAQQQGFDQSSQARQRAMAEMLQRRGQPLNELNALLSGQQVGMPQMPSFNPGGLAQAPNFSGAAQNQYGAALDASNASNASTTGAMNGAMGLASLFMLSDKRLKKDIMHVFTLPNKIKVYKYRFVGSDRMELGVLAQEVQEIMPDAVAVDSHGFLRVNYDKVLA